MLTCTFLGAVSEPIYGNSRGRAIAKDMNLHPILCDVIVSKPQKPQVVSVILSDKESMKYLLDVSSDCHKLLS